MNSKVTTALVVIIMITKSNPSITSEKMLLTKNDNDSISDFIIVGGG